MNLKENLKPEVLEQLNEAAKLYPVIVSIVLKDLEQTNYFTDLKYFTVLDLQQILKLDLNKFSSIKKLFNR